MQGERAARRDVVLDGEHTTFLKWQVSEQPDGSRCWTPADNRSASAAPKRAGEPGAAYAVATSPAQLIHVVSPSELRVCRLWQWRDEVWLRPSCLSALATHASMQAMDEKRRIADAKFAHRKKDVVDAKRLAKLEQAEAKRAAVDGGHFYIGRRALLHMA